MKEKKTETKRRRLKVRLRVGEDPTAWDTETQEELTSQLAEIRILPLGRAVATLQKHDKAGKAFIENDEVATSEADVVSIEGIWHARVRDKLEEARALLNKL